MFQYYSLSNGDNKTTNVLSENNFITSYLSFVLEEVSQENMKALKDGTVFFNKLNQILKNW